MMSDYDRTMELIDAAYNSAGKSQQQFAKNMETIEFKTKRLKNSWETLRQSFVNSDFFKGAADSANNLLQSLNELSGKDYPIFNLFTILRLLILPLCYHYHSLVVKALRAFPSF